MRLLSKKDIVFLMLIFFSVGCTENDNELVNDFEHHKTQLDKKIEKVIQQQEYYQDSIKILTQNQQYLDTISLAKEIVFLRNAKFLLETNYDEANHTIEKINDKKINDAEAKTTLENLNKQYQDLLSKYKLD